MSSRRHLLVAGLAIVAVGTAFGVARSLRRDASSSVAPTPDASTPLGHVVVKVFDDGRPAADRWVVFHDRNGRAISFTKTGADGRAAGGVEPRGMVTVIDASSMKKLLTIREVMPNDELVVGEPEDEGGVATTACTTLVSVPGPHPKAPVHVVSLGVGTTEMPNPRQALSMPVLQRYLVDGEFAVVAEALGSNREPMAFGYAKAGCSDSGAVDVRTSAWSTDYRAFRIHLAGGEGTSVATAELAVRRGEDRFERGRRTGALGENPELRFLVPRPLGADIQYRLTVDYASTPDRIAVAERRRAMPDETMIDLKRTLPRLSQLSIASTVPARPVVRWTMAGDAEGADATLVRVWWPASHEHEWTIIGPPSGASSVELPALPDELAAFRPLATGISAAAALVDASFLSGYRDIRTKGLFALEDPPEEGDNMITYSRTGAIDF